MIPTLPDYVTIDKTLTEFINSGIKLKFIVASAVDAAM